MLHENLNRILFDRKISRRELREALGISRSTLHRYLSGDTPMPADKIELVARFLNLPVSRLFGEDTTNISQIEDRIKKLEKRISILENQRI